MRKTILHILSVVITSGISSFFTLSAKQPQSVQTTRPSETEEMLVAQLTGHEVEQQIAALVELAARFNGRLGTPQAATLAALLNTLQRARAPIIRIHAAHALELAGSSTVIDGLLMALRSETNLATRKAIIYALARHPAPEVTAALLQLLNHKEKELRATTAYALAELADTAAANTLLELMQKRLKRDDDFARSQAARGLGRIGYRAALPALLETLQRDKAQMARREAAIALGWLSNPQDTAVITALRQATSEDDPTLRTAAVEALQRINSRYERQD